jgi:hypothetical protein
MLRIHFIHRPNAQSSLATRVMATPARCTFLFKFLTPYVKLPYKFSSIAFAFYMAGIIALVMSAVLTALGSGIEDGYIQRVLRSYAVAFPVAFICVVIFRPLIVYLVKKTVHSPTMAGPSDSASLPPS